MTKRSPAVSKPASEGEEAFLLHCRVYRFTPEREYRFCPPRRWRFDFAVPDKKVAIEVEGGTWSNGRHTRGKGYEVDILKYNTAVLLGWRVLRYTTGMVERGEAIDGVRALLRSL